MAYVDPTTRGPSSSDTLINRFKVVLESYSNGLSRPVTGYVRFDVQPTISETISVSYDEYDPVHLPGTFQVYRGTKSRSWSLGEVKLVSRSPQEASLNQQYVNQLRGWTAPFFGLGTANATDEIVYAGNAAEYAAKSKNAVKPNLSGSEPSTSNPSYSMAPVGTPPYDVQMRNAANQAELDNRADMNGIRNVPGMSEYDIQKVLNAQHTKQTVAPNSNVPDSRVIVNSTQKPSEAVQASTNGELGKRWLGAPPEVLYLTAYSLSESMDGTLSVPTNITRVPVVLTNLSITWPNDVDYIPTIDGQPFPIIMTIGIELSESHSPAQMEAFDLFKYRKGLLPNF